MTVHVTFAGPATVELADGGVRTLRGRAVPFGVASAPSSVDGRRYRFHGAPATELVGSVAVREHDDLTPIGVVRAADVSDDGIDVVIEGLDTTAGRDALVEATHGVRTGLSVAFDPVTSRAADDGVVDVDEWTLSHIGHVRHPAFGDATQVVAASTTPQEVDPVETDTQVLAEQVSAPVAVTRRTRVPALAEYGYAVLHAQSGDTAALQRLADYNQAINLAAGETLVTNISGVIPVPIVGPVLDARPYDRPIVSALGVRPGPSAGASWKHPIVSDPLADAAAVPELTSANDTLGITSVDVAWTAIKRSTTVSREAQIYSEPAVMGIVGEQLARAYARGTEVLAAAGLKAVTGGNTAIELAADGSDAIAQVVAGSTIHYGQVGAPADLLLVSPTDYAAMAGWKADDGRQLFPMEALSNAYGSTTGARSFGGNIAGVPLVVSWALADGENYLVSSDYVGVYEGNRATISVELAVFGVTVGVFGTFAFKALLPKAVTAVSIAAA